MYGGEVKGIEDFFLMGKPEGKYHLEDLGVDLGGRRIIKKKKIGREVMDWDNWEMKWDVTSIGPGIVLHSYNEIQPDALFLNFILVNISTCFGQTYCPSSGVLILYSQHSSISTSPADSQHNQYDKYQLM
jgi:hypothetical protein